MTLDERILVAEHEGYRTGFAALLAGDNFLHSLFVDPDYQGQGFGSALLEAVQNSFTSTGALKCMKANTQALTFYQRHGWKRVGSGESEQGEYLLLHYLL